MFYIFHGDDAHAQKETLNDLMAKLGDAPMLELNTARFDSTVSFGQLRQVCDSIPFLSKRRLVIVEGLLGSSPGREFVDQLVDYLPHLPKTTRLVFLEAQKLRANHRLLKLAKEAENGYVKAFTRPEGSSLERWVRKRVETYGGEITPRAVHMLVTNVGNEMGLLDGEIEKLALYKADDGPIDADDVVLLCPFVAESSIFDMVDALGNRDGRTAATLLHKKLTEGSDPFYLFAMVVRQFRLLIQVKELADVGQRPPAISKTLGIHSFVAGKMFQQSQRFSLLQLEQIYAHLLETDVGVKTGRADMTTSLHLLVAALAT